MFDGSLAGFCRSFDGAVYVWAQRREYYPYAQVGLWRRSFPVIEIAFDKGYQCAYPLWALTDIAEYKFGFLQKFFIELF